MAKDLVQDFFKRDLSDAELDALTKRLDSETEAMRFSDEASRYHKTLGAAAVAALALKAAQVGQTATGAGSTVSGFAALFSKAVVVKVAMATAGIAVVGGGALLVEKALFAPPVATVTVEATPATLEAPAAKPVPAQETGNQLALVLKLVEAANVKALVTNEQGIVVRDLGVQNWPAGTHRLTWDGLDDGQKPLQAGRYQIVIRWNDKETGKWIELRQATH